MAREVRVRFAPSPTGALHIGGVRTALYNYLFARQAGGKMILRIEDTDSQRFVAGAEEYILESLKWSGIEIDEGVGVGGPHAPYRQSERREIYLAYALQLVEAGWAYYAFDTSEQLDQCRQAAEAEGKTFAYNYSVRTTLPTSLCLSAEEVEQRIERGDQWVIRFKMPEDEVVEMSDLIRGEVRVNTSTLDDKVLYKSVDRLPTYHLANVVDDKLMEISHVIRGEEWLPSLPLHFLLYRAFGWSDVQPEFAHLPLLLKPTGGGKLSKRDGDKLGFPVFPLRWQPAEGEASRGYREDGYLSEAFINMLALLGWNPGTEQELFTMEELIEAFSLERVSKAGARFQPEKARWFNAQWISSLSAEQLASLVQPLLIANGVEVSDELAGKAAYIMRERVVLLSDFWDLISYFFVAPTEYDAKQVKKYWKGDNPRVIAEVRDLLAAIDDFSLENTEAIVGSWISEKGYGMGQVMNTLRLALVGAGKGPGMYDVTEFIGREECVKRIDSLLANLPLPEAKA
ncbi:MAG: glutamate--tRNA ligase [Rikenellaceae bacterium]